MMWANYEFFKRLREMASKAVKSDGLLEPVVTLPQRRTFFPRRSIGVTDACVLRA